MYAKTDVTRSIELGGHSHVVMLNFLVAVKQSCIKEQHNQEKETKKEREKQGIIQP